MNDKQIITQKEKNYIETLYLNFNIENASISNDDHSVIKYYNVLRYMVDNMFSTAKCLGDADGRTWYQFPNYRLGIMDYDKAKRANQFNCVLQYEQHHLWTLDQELSGLDLPFNVDRKYYHIKRIDITKIAKLKEDYTDNYGYISPYRGIRNEYGTIYLGHRKNGNVFRIYNKTKELLDTKNYKKIALMSAYFGDIEDLTTFELELHRKYLKASLGIETLDQLDLVYSAYKNIVGKIRFYESNDHNKKLVSQDNAKRIKGYVLTKYEDYQRVEKKRYKTSKKYAINQVNKIIDRYIESMELEKTNEEYLSFYNEAMRERVDYNLKDMVLTFEDTPLSDAMAQMTAKHKLMRDNQTNELEKEAERLFG